MLVFSCAYERIADEKMHENLAVYAKLGFEETERGVGITSVSWTGRIYATATPSIVDSS